MPEDETSGTAPSSGGQPSPQLSMAEIEAAIAKALNERIPGLMSSFQKQVNDAVGKSGDNTTPNQPKPTVDQTPEERALKAREEALATKELEVTKRSLAIEYGVPADSVTGESETEMRLAATTYLLQSKGVSVSTPSAPKVTAPSPAPTGNPPAGGSTLTPLEKIKTGLRATP